MYISLFCRAFLTQNLSKKFFKGFSLVEMLITLVVVSVLLSAFVPVITKKMRKNIDISGGGSVPVGTIVAFLGQEAPRGWLLCNGEEYDKDDYPKLANHLGKDRNGKYTVPDLRGYTTVGASEGNINDAINGNSFYNE
ncbi:MAG: tail fiber protein [Candidatus Gastranaerophilales bacterium]|nr:tail fiber protein [Candidatus Gastranaerophilales bacterium]